MSVTVMSRKQAVEFCRTPHDVDTITVSISDPHMTYSSEPFRSAANRVLNILRLQFSDADRPGPDVYGREADLTD